MIRCTLTGLDEWTDLGRAAALSDAHARLEWGMLYSPKANAEGAPRYPSRRRVEEILRRLDGRPLALHVCGSAVANLLAGRDGIEEVATAFPRVQVNMAAERQDLDALRRLLERNPDTTFITQRNAANERLVDVLRGLPNHAVLFDASLGTGAVPREWPEILDGVQCGYAGGLGPANLSAELPRIWSASAGRAAWVDMETRIRDDLDRLDLEECAAALAAFEAYAFGAVA